MARAPTEIRSLARAHTAMSIKVLASVAQNSTNDSARVSAAVALLDRGWGKSPQSLTGADGEGAITVTIRHIVEEIRTKEDQGKKLLSVEGRDGRVIDAKPVARAIGNGEDV